MSDEAKPNDNVIPTQQTVEVLDTSGNTMNRGDSSIASIFDKIETAKNAGEDVKEVLKEVSIPKEQKAAKPEVKHTENPLDKKIEEPTDLDRKLTQQQDKKDEEEISRSKLREEAEVKKEDKKEEVKAEKVEDKKVETEVKSEEDVSDDELKVLPHDKPKTAKRIQALLKKIDTINAESVKTKTEATEKATKLAELEKKLSEVKTVDPKTDEAIKKQLDELSMYRRRYDLEKDPEITSKFTGRIDSSEASIITTLKNYKIGDNALNLIKEEGGWLKFSGSTRPIALNDGTTITASEYSDLVLKALPLADRKAVESAMLDQISTKREKDALFEREQKTANEYFQKQEEEAKKQQQAHQQRLQEVAQKIENWDKSITERNDWLKVKDIPPNATAEQKAALEENNKYTKQLIALKNKTIADIGSQNPDAILDIVFDSVAYYQARRELAQLKAENARLKSEFDKSQGEINKIRSSSRTLPKTGSISAGGGGQPTKKESAPVGLEAAFNAIEAGELGGKNDE